jgi:hypothetical protein
MIARRRLLLDRLCWCDTCGQPGIPRSYGLWGQRSLCDRCDNIDALRPRYAVCQHCGREGAHDRDRCGIEPATLSNAGLVELLIAISNYKPGAITAAIAAGGAPYEAMVVSYDRPAAFAEALAASSPEDRVRYMSLFNVPPGTHEAVIAVDAAAAAMARVLAVAGNV